MGGAGRRRDRPLRHPYWPVRSLPADHYARSGERWALGGELVYGPIAAELVGTSPHSLASRIVLDAGELGWWEAQAAGAIARCGIRTGR